MARKSNWQNEYFHDEALAFAHVESILWPNGPVCPRCEGVDNATKLTLKPAKRVKKVKGEVVVGRDGKPVMVEQPVRHGVWKCKNKECRAQFTVRVGTLFEESRMPMTKWLQAIYLMAASKKGISTHQLKRTLECDQKSAWFLGHRIRKAMESNELRPFGQGGGPVEVDETYIGRDPARKMKRGGSHKMKVLSLVDRNTGRAKSFVVDDVKAATLMPILKANIAKEAVLMTDEHSAYQSIGKEFSQHEHVRHSIGEYAYGPISTNQIEGFFSVFKRGMKGVYQHCSKEHLHRYLAEFDFRYTNRIATGVDDKVRARMVLEGFRGKRLTYRGSDSSVI